MARIRTIKPDFWKNEKLCSLPISHHMLAGALLNYADDEGYFKANPALVFAECCPLRPELLQSIPEILGSLQTIGYLRLGTGPDGIHYGHVVNFDEHQRVSHPTPSKTAKLSITWVDPNNPPENFWSSHESLRPEGKGREGNRREGKTDMAAGKQPPAAEGFSPVFIEAMGVYPRRSGDNPKGMAWQQWQLRVKEGVDEIDMLNGTVRYACWCEYTQKINTETVMQAKRFYGRERPFANDWTIPAKGNGAGIKPAKLERALDSIRRTNDALRSHQQGDADDAHVLPAAHAGS